MSNVSPESSESSNLTGNRLSQDDWVIKDLNTSYDKDALYNDIFKNFDEEMNPMTLVFFIKEQIYKRLPTYLSKKIITVKNSSYNDNNGSLKVTIWIIDIILEKLSKDSKNMDIRRKLIACLFVLRIFTFNLVKILLPNSKIVIENNDTFKFEISNGLSLEERDNFNSITSDLMNKIKINKAYREKGRELETIYNDLLTPLYIRLTTPEPSLEFTAASGKNRSSLPNTELIPSTGLLPGAKSTTSPTSGFFGKIGSRLGRAFTSPRRARDDSSSIVEHSTVESSKPESSNAESSQEGSQEGSTFGGKSRKRKRRSRRSTRKTSRRRR